MSIAVMAANVCSRGRAERPVPSDAAIILGAYTDGFRPSPPLMLRLRAGLHLYRRGYVRYVIVSGGQGADEKVAESTAMKRFLVLNGIPQEVVLEERTSTDTLENLENSDKLMRAMGMHTGVVVTSDYHLPRALAVARQLGMSVTGYASISHRSEFRFAVREVFAQVLYWVHGHTGQ